MNPESQDSTKPKHDTLFKVSTEKKEIVVQLLKQFMPPEFLANLDVAKLKMENKLLTDLGLNIHEADALVKVPCLDGQNSVFVLIEHKSSMDEKVLEQTFRYVALIRDRDYKNRGAKGSMTPVYQIILYHGQGKYSKAKSLRELFANDPIMHKMIEEGPQVIDIKRLPDSELQRDPLLGAMLMAFKHVREPDYLSRLKSCIDAIPNKEKHINFINAVIGYVAGFMPWDRRNELIHMLNQITHGDEIMMTIAEGWMKQGRQEGMQKGRQEGMQEGMQKGIDEERKRTVQKLLASGLSVQQVASILDISVARVKRMAKLSTV